jgi:pimeloyl-ACP methyl ester carboxylesterase
MGGAAGRAFLSSLVEIGRLILFDRRGIGLSDRVGFTPSVDATAQDIGTVLDAAGSRRAVLFGASEGGPACIKFAADHPDRVAGLILFASLAKGSAAPDYPHALHASQFDVWLKELITIWGGPAGIDTFAPSLSGDPQARAWWAGLLRAASSPGALKGVLEALRDADVRNILSRISAPTLVLHRRGDRAVRMAPGGISPATSRRRGSSNSTAPITGFLRAISNRSLSASNNSSAVSRPDRAREISAKDRRACTYEGTHSISRTPSPPA